MSNPALLVGYDSSDDAAVYRVSDEVAVIETVDFFTPIVDDPYLFGQIAAANALSDVYAMGGEPKLALNIMCLADKMDDHNVREILRGGYDKAYEAGAIITGGHTIHGAEPIYGLAVTGFVHPKKVLTNASARPGDVLLLTKPLGIGILTTAAKAGLVEQPVLERIYRQMAALNKTARDIMLRYEIHSCTDVTGFSLMGHSYEMAQGSGMSLHIESRKVPFHPEALEMAAMGFIPAGAYRNRDYESVADVDGVMLVVEPIASVGEQERALIERIRSTGAPAVLVINKIDTVEKQELLAVIAAYSEALPWRAIVPVSAQNGDGLEELLNELTALAVPGPQLFPDDMISDMPEKQICAELVREKLLLCLDKEIPHGTAVEVTKFSERDNGIIDMDVTIYCEKDSHKGIIIGKHGDMLKRISSLARRDIEKFMGAKVYMETWVKVKENWRDNVNFIRARGYDEQ